MKKLLSVRTLALLGFCFLSLPVFTAEQGITKDYQSLGAGVLDWLDTQAPILIEIKESQGEAAHRQRVNLLLDRILESKYQRSAIVANKDEINKLKIDLESYLEDASSRLTSLASWRTLLPKLNPERDLVKDLYRNHLVPRIPWLKEDFTEDDVSDFVLSQLDIDVCNDLDGTNCMKRYWEKHGVIKLRELVKSDRPRLVIGCGDRHKTEAPFTSNRHIFEDTIDPTLHRNPSIIGPFGKSRNVFVNDEGIEEFYLPSSHYQVVMDEAGLDLDQDTWQEIERVLKPGGFFLSHFFYPWMNHSKLPANSRLRFFRLYSYKAKPGNILCGSFYNTERENYLPYPLSASSIDVNEDQSKYQAILDNYGEKWWMEKLGFMYANVLVAKLNADGSLPKEFPAQDFPSGIEIMDLQPIANPIQFFQDSN